MADDAKELFLLLKVSAQELVRHLSGSSGAQTLCLLLHAYGSALLLIPTRHQEHSEVFLQLLKSSPRRMKSIRQRFQLLTALHCWWQLRQQSSLWALQRVRMALEEELPGAEEAIGEQDLISTNEHAEVARYLPQELQPLEA